MKKTNHMKFHSKFCFIITIAAKNEKINYLNINSYNGLKSKSPCLSIYTL